MRSKVSSGDLITKKSYALPALFSVTIALLGLFFYTSLRNNLLSPIWIFFVLYITAYLLYVYAAARVVPAAANNYNWITPFVIWTGIIYRLILLHSPPSLSTDIYRYIWDGRLTTHGINPFRWSPFDPRLASLRDWRIWVPMEYKAYQTVYMSISQACFALCYAIFGSSIIGFKLIYTLFDIGNMLLLRKLLKKLEQPDWKVVWYAWCPLPIIEIALSGHQDVCGVFLLIATFILFASPRRRLSAITLAAAVLTKGFPLLLIPLLSRKAGWRYGVLCVIALIALGFPQILETKAFLHGMQQYLMNVEVNGSVHALIDYILSGFVVKHLKIANIITDLIIIGFVLGMVRKPIGSMQEVMRRTLIIVCSCLMVVPSLFPWYLVWLIPIAACVRSRPSTSIIVLVGTVVMSYTFYFTHQTYWWSAWVEYLPFYIILTWEWANGYWSSVDEPVSARLGAARTFDPVFDTGMESKFTPADA
jgi:alpha-1,6-mannosyltransferase